MPAKKSAADKKPRTVAANDPNDATGTLKCIGGSQSDSWNTELAYQVFQTLWIKNSDEEESSRQYSAAGAGLLGIGPSDELEGMIAVQLLAAHNATVECYRRAMHNDQTFEGWRENLNQANKLSRTYATLLEALNRHRGKGQQKVTVEHVHVHSGGQAVVGTVEAPGGGIPARSEDQAHARQIAHAPQPTMPSADTAREPVPIARDEERPMSDAWRNVTGRAEGQ